MKTLERFIGQNKIKKQLSFLIYPSLKEKGYCDHILLEGSPGTGKTTLASIIASENNLPIKKIISSSLKSKSDLMSFFCDIEERSVIFLDEVHRLDVVIEEMLYQIMDEKKINIVIGKEGNSRFVSVDLPSFTIIAATTLSGLLSKPFKDRFSFKLHMRDYSEYEIEKIVENNLNSELDSKYSNYIAKHSKNVPRTAINITKRINDYCKYSNKQLNKDEIDNVLDLLDYRLGLNKQDLDYLNLVKNQGPLSINTIATKLSMEKINIITDIEPYLLKKNYISLSSQGRSITKQGINLLKKII